MSRSEFSSSRVINLGELRPGDDFPEFAAIHAPSKNNPFVLSPRAMRWDRHTHLNRLDDCREFWLARKKKLRVNLSDLFAPLLLHHYGEDCLAVFGRHPWQCLLYLYYQLNHGRRGVYLLQSRLDQNVFRRLDWESWFAPQQVLARHLGEMRARRFVADEFSARQARLRRFVERGGVATPAAMYAADANSIARRFGSWLGAVWRWTFSADSRLQGFPWLALTPEAAPRVERELEYPVNQWAYVEVLLREDFTRLAELLPRGDCLHINRMRWEISLFNDSRVRVELSFRHPYMLQQDAPEFATAIYQARYIFDDLMRKLQARDRDLDLPAAMPFTSWRLEVCERVLLAPALWDLFAQEVGQIDYRQILELQNKLPLAFECYHANASFSPEHSFSRGAIGNTPQPDYELEQWSGSARDKPLFYYPEPQPISGPGDMRRIFLERNAQQWWLSGDALQTLRDYYMLEDSNGRRCWVYRDADGAWYKQGEYY